MPAPVLKALAKKSEKSIQDLERYWKEAKESAKDKGFNENEDRFWAYTMGIVKRRAGLTESLQEFVDFIIENLDEEETREIKTFLSKEKLEKPANFSLLAQYAQVSGLSEEECLGYWEAAKKEAHKFKMETGIEGKDVIEMAMKIFMEMLPTPAEQKEKAESEKAEADSDKDKESKEDKPKGDAPKEEKVEEYFANLMMSDSNIDEASNEISKEEMKALKKAGIDVKKVPKKELKKAMDKIRKKGKKNNAWSLFGYGLAGFAGGYMASKAIEKAFSMFSFAGK